MMQKSRKYDAIILGAGGAGLMCAGVASKRGKKILVLDHADKPGKKILISGGGRCNFTNLRVGAQNFLSQNPHFSKSALSRYTPDTFISLVERHNIAYHEKTLGQLFCDGSAKQIVQMLLDECAPENTDFCYGENISSVHHQNGNFTVETDKGNYSSGALIIATGGPSIPKMGATGFAYQLAKQFGLKLVEPRPALVPLTLGKDDTLFKSLSGVSTAITARHKKTAFTEAGLFTHKGMSGPAILQISSYWKHGDPVSINFCPEMAKDWLLQAKLCEPKSTLKKILSAALPERLATVLCERIGVDDMLGSDLGNISDKKLAKLSEALNAWAFYPNGTEGFAKAEVTLGGISTQELSSTTMEAKKMPGLYCIGEAVDVTGWLGGYNFQWAWASGWAAGQAL